MLVGHLEGQPCFRQGLDDASGKGDCPRGTGMTDTLETCSLVALLRDATEMGFRTQRSKKLA